MNSAVEVRTAWFVLAIKLKKQVVRTDEVRLVVKDQLVMSCEVDSNLSEPCRAEELRAARRRFIIDSPEAGYRVMNHQSGLFNNVG